MEHAIYLYEIGKVGDLKGSMNLGSYMLNDNDIVVSYGATSDPISYENYHFQRYNNMLGANLVLKRTVWFDDEDEFLEAENEALGWHDAETSIPISNYNWGTSYHNLAVYNAQYYNYLLASYNAVKFNPDLFVAVDRG
jgi:hypothetical protein